MIQVLRDCIYFLAFCWVTKGVLYILPVSHLNFLVTFPDSCKVHKVWRPNLQQLSHELVIMQQSLSTALSRRSTTCRHAQKRASRRCIRRSVPLKTRWWSSSSKLAPTWTPWTQTAGRRCTAPPPATTWTSCACWLNTARPSSCERTPTWRPPWKSAKARRKTLVAPSASTVSDHFFLS